MLRASLLSTGGLGNVSGLHDAFVPHRFATDQMFTEAITVGQISPGPNGLWVISLGYLMHGVLGSTAALVAIVIPPFFVLGVDRLYSRVQHHPAVEGFVRGLSIAVIGTFATVLIKLLLSSGFDMLRLGLAVIAFALGCLPRIPIIGIMSLCGLIGFLARR